MFVWVLSLALAAQVATAPSAALTLSGIVVSGTPAAPVVGASIRAGSASATSGADGRFVLTLAVPEPRPVTIPVTVSARGFIDQRLDAPTDGRPLDVSLIANPEFREDVIVSAPEAADAVAPPTLVVTPGTVRSVPGAIDNVFRVLQTLPGVSGTDDFGSRLSVRGGGPDQNLTVMDGVEIHDPYRLFGLTSAFNPETIDRFELTAGGFGPQYGDRLSSIFVVDNRAGTTSRRIAGSAALSVTDANVVLEGELPHGMTGSWLVTGRRTYYDLFAERITHQQLPSFNDVQTKIVWSPHPGRQITLFALRSREATDAQFDGGGASRLGVTDASRNDVVALTFTTPLGSRATSKTVAAWYRYRDALDIDGTVKDDAIRANTPDAGGENQSTIIFTRALGVRDVSLREDVTLAVSRRQTASLGFDLHDLPTSWGWQIRGDRNGSVANGSSVLGGAGLPDLLDSSGSGDRAGGWLEDDVRLASRAHVAGGLRLDWNRLASETLVSPRVRLTLDVSPRTTLRLATGRYTQSPGYEKLLQADYFVDLSNARALGLESERSWHVVSGLEHRFGEAITGRVESYYKTFDRLLVGRLETPEETAARVAQYDFPADLAWSVPTAPQITTVPTNGGSGRSYGMDVYLEKRTVAASDRLSGWISYTWGHADVTSYGRTYSFDYDRRHAFSLVTTWRALNRIDIGATLRLASGFPNTRAVGVRIASVLAPGAVKGAPASLIPARDPSGQYLWTVDNGSVDNLNTSRLPPYARLDVRITYMPSRTSRWQLYVEVINVLDRRNAGSENPELQYDPTSDRPRLTFSPQGGFPLLPSFGFRKRF